MVHVGWLAGGEALPEIVHFSHINWMHERLTSCLAVCKKEDKEKIMLKQRMAVWLVVSLLLSGLVFADAITIANYSFEDPVLADNTTAAKDVVPNWVCGGGGAPANYIWNPPSSRFTGAEGSGTPKGADGANVLYMGNSGATGNFTTVTQTLSGVTLQQGTYNLSAAVGQATGFTAFGHNYLILQAGTAWVAWVDFTPGELITAEFITKNLTYEVASDNQYIGQTITIRLQSSLTSSTARISCWDNVHLDFTGVPEPCTMVLILTGGGLCLLRKKRV